MKSLSVLALGSGALGIIYSVWPSASMAQLEIDEIYSLKNKIDGIAGKKPWLVVKVILDDDDLHETSPMWCADNEQGSQQRSQILKNLKVLHEFLISSTVSKFPEIKIHAGFFSSGTLVSINTVSSNRNRVFYGVGAIQYSLFGDTAQNLNVLNASKDKQQVGHSLEKRVFKRFDSYSSNQVAKSLWDTVVTSQIGTALQIDVTDGHHPIEFHHEPKSSRVSQFIIEFLVAHLRRLNDGTELVLFPYADVRFLNSSQHSSFIQLFSDFQIKKTNNISDHVLVLNKTSLFLSLADSDEAWKEFLEVSTRTTLELQVGKLLGKARSEDQVQVIRNLLEVMGGPNVRFFSGGFAADEAPESMVYSRLIEILYRHIMIEHDLCNFSQDEKVNVRLGVRHGPELSADLYLTPDTTDAELLKVWGRNRDLNGNDILRGPWPHSSDGASKTPRLPARIK